MASSACEEEMVCDHSILGQQELDLSQKPKKVNVQQVQKLQRYLMGASKVLGSAEETMDFLIKR